MACAKWLLPVPGGPRKSASSRCAMKRPVASSWISARFIFFNEIDFPSLLLPLRERFGKSVKLLHLSHGLDSTDICIAQQIERGRLGTERYNGGMVRRLGSKLQCEADYRRYLDGAICLSPLDAELERWLGARRTIWLSQPITEPPLDHKPVVGRVGCVATLDHVPNYDGLVEAFEALAKLKVSNLSFRLVGSPASRGAELGRRYNFVEYLGALSDAELRSEAASWSCFVHPIFHYARGRSTKLAVVLGWGLPLATTAAGARGYIWDESIFPLARTPPELAASVSEQLSLSEFERRREWTLQIAGIQPSSDVITQQALAFLRALRGEDSEPATI